MHVLPYAQRQSHEFGCVKVGPTRIISLQSRRIMGYAQKVCYLK